MKRFAAVKFGLAVTCVSALLVASCAHNDSSVYVVGVMAPTGGSGGNLNCSYKADPTLAQLFSGTIDVAFLAAYRPVVLVGNQLITQGKTEGFRTETARIQLQGAVVTVEDSEGKQLDSFTTLSAGIADPSSGQAPGYGLVAVTLVSPDVVTRMRTGKFPNGTADDPKIVVPPGGTKRLVVRFKVFGQTLGGQSIESNEAQFPVNACNGCLVYFPPGSNDSSNLLPQPNCLAAGEEGTIITPCVRGQDEAIDCRTCPGEDVCDPAKR